MKIGFVTVVELGLSCIEEIYKIGGKLELLITLNDDKALKKSGRIFLDNFAKNHRIPLFKIDNINQPEVINVITEYQIDWLFIIGWSQIANKEVLFAPKRGCVGMHPTLLPIGRGRAAVPWAILKGLEETGVTLFKLDEGVDTGPIIGQVKIPITLQDTATSLYRKVNEAHVMLISKYWNDIIQDKITLLPQKKSLATYWPVRKPEDGEITNDMMVEEAERLVRAVTKPYPGAFYCSDKGILRIWKARIFNQKEDLSQQIAIRLINGYLIAEVYEYE